MCVFVGVIMFSSHLITCLVTHVDRFTQTPMLSMPISTGCDIISFQPVRGQHIAIITPRPPGAMGTDIWNKRSRTL